MTQQELDNTKSIILNKLFEKNFVNMIGPNSYTSGLIYNYIVYKLEQIITPFFQKIEQSNKSIKKIYCEYKTKKLRIAIDFVSIKECEEGFK